MPEFVRARDGSVIGITLENHPDAAPDAPAPTTMIPVVPIPEGSTTGPLPDPVAEADALGAANDRIAELEAQLAASSAPPAGGETTAAPTWEAVAAGGAPPADPNAPPAQ